MLNAHLAERQVLMLDLSVTSMTTGKMTKFDVPDRAIDVNNKGGERWDV